MRQGAGDLVRYRDDNLDELSSLIALKGSLAAPELADLVASVDNAVIERVFREIVAEAPRERAVLERLVSEWTTAAQAEAATPVVDPAPSNREILAEWIHVLELASARARAVAERAPTPTIRLRLELVADADAIRARMLKALL